ncbi:DUF134 domain-containing protein [Pelosinus propionicus]|uniref:Predicted DNA-binding protein, UPF0251 family n=1 Tax=Pelosinus propionicus DSM 13327 TaxID=1123291 RepID=A0A1I4IG31_9FIRM|nr:DUF134 domain-containing protein [Pelosinus propionicus]SFL53290.1 Predicted DNA-binding protein, UPF0251 family [Pelosinus propionicus DSM 13327]
MTRRRCCGLVEQEPIFRKFVPDGQMNSGTIILLVEELEALRLKDLDGMDQVNCAIKMGVSRATFQRILQSARKKMVTSLINGQTIIIQGGNYMIKYRKFECKDCGHIWEVEPCSEGGKHGYEIPCPQCESMKKIKLAEDGTRHACGGGHGHGHDHESGCCGGHNKS